ncbi:MAG: hypothetical protein AAF741_11320 [Bacteroidota bacterium]
MSLKQLFLRASLLIMALFMSSVFLGAQSGGLSIGKGVVLGDTTQVHVLTTNSQERIIGSAMDIDGDKLLFIPRYAEEVVEFPTAEVRSVRLFQVGYSDNNLSDGTYLYTALPGANRGGRYRNVSVLGSLAEFDLNKNVRLGVGFLLPVGIAVSQRIRASLSPGLHVGLSNQSVWSLRQFDDNELAGDLAGLVTLGDNRLFLSMGYHFFYSTSFFSEDSRGVSMMVGGQISDQWHLYSEWMYTETRSFRGSGLIPSFSASCSLNRWRIRFGVFWGYGELVTDSPLPIVGADYRW